jgi:quinolinate synthase
MSELKKERNAVVLAHNYQLGEVQEIADYFGDSLELARAATKTDADVIVFCGVRFMAETAKILNPEKMVLLPVKEAGCPMADMATAEQLREMRKQHPGAAVVCYVNSSVEVKAESDVCCTSSNAVRVVESLPNRQIIFVPDRNLGAYVQSRLDSKEIILWEGYCSTHESLGREDVMRLREMHPCAEFIAHPECTPAVLKLADGVCSTSGMLEYSRNSRARGFIIGTEVGLLYRLRKENPDKRFYPAGKMLCPDMKMTTVVDVVDSLKYIEHVINVPEHVANRARHSLERMLEL